MKPTTKAGVVDMKKSVAVALVMSLSAFTQADDSVSGADAHSARAALASDILHGKTGTPGLKWGVKVSPQSDSSTHDIASVEQARGYKWVARKAEAQEQSFAASESAAYKWGIRSTADQSAYKWGIRSTADQSAYKWGIRSTADQSAYKWGIRSTADQSAYKWGIRSTADQSAYKWGIR